MGDPRDFRAYDEWLLKVQALGFSETEARMLTVVYGETVQAWNRAGVDARGVAVVIGILLGKARYASNTETVEKVAEITEDFSRATAAVPPSKLN